LSVVSLCVLGLGAHVHASEINEDKYQIYYGDFNNDGVDGDIYFHAKDSFVLLHGDIAIPLFINGKDGFVFYVNGDGTADPLDLPEEDLVNYIAAVEGFNYVFGDFNNDGNTDVRVFAFDGVGSTSFYGSSSSALPVASTSSQNSVDDIPDARNFTQADPAIHDATVGHLNPSVGVSGGAVNASIPVVIPPGRAGMQPNVSISYSSDTQHSLLGYGWSLSVGGSISRCGSSWALDQKTRRVMDDSLDHLCLGGARLMLHTGSVPYGQNGAVYSPESQPQIRVTQSGGDLSSSGTSFQVDYSNGHKSFYGTDAQSKALREPDGTTVSWHLRKKEDLRSKNTIEYEYDNSNHGYVLLDDVYYTGSGSTKGNRRVSFTYDNREDVRVSFRNGGKQLKNKKLRKIETYVDQKLVRRYSLDYVTEDIDTGQYEEPGYGYKCKREPDLCEVNTSDPITLARASRVESIEVCAFDALDNASCLPKTLLNYAPLVDGFYDKQLTAMMSSNYRGRLNTAGDFDGDGVADIILGRVDSGNQVYLSSTQSSEHLDTDVGHEGVPGLVQNKAVSAAVNDFNLDGRSDILGFQSYSRLSISSWDGLNFVSTPLSDTDGDAILMGCTDEPYFERATLSSKFRDCTVYVMDVNGDSKPDLLVPRQAWGTPDTVNYHVYINESTGLDQGYRFGKAVVGNNNAYSFVMNNDTPATLGDFDGDGITDLFSSRKAVSNSRLEIFKTLVSDGELQGFASHYYSDYHDVNPILDVNGDGLTDIIVGTTLRVNHGETFVTNSTVYDNASIPRRGGGYNYSRDYARFFDYNKDGITDVLVPSDRISSSECTAHVAGGCSGRSLQEMDDLDTYRWVLRMGQVSDTGEIHFTSNLRFQPIEATLKDLTVADVDGDGYMDIAVRLGQVLSSGRATITNPGFPAEAGLYVYSNRGIETDKLKTITTGLGVVHEFDYASLAGNDDFYNACFEEQSAAQCADDTTFPYKNIGSNHVSVREYRTSNGLGELNKTRFSYRKARTHQQGRGFQGFGRIIEEKYDLQTATAAFAKVTNTYAQTHPTSGFQIEGKTEVRNDAGAWQVVQSKTAVPAVANGTLADTFVVYPGSSVARQFELDGSDISIQQQSQVVNAYGLKTEAFSVANDADFDMKQTTNATQSYTTVLDDWWFKLDSSSVRKRVEYRSDLGLPSAALTDVTVTQAFDYDAANTRSPSKQTVSTSDSTLTSITTTEYAGVFDQVSKVTTTSNGTGDQSIQGTRWQSLDYSTDGYFVAATYNSQWGSSVPASQSVHDPATGVAELAIDVNGITATTTYDAFGRAVHVATPLAPDATTGMQRCAGTICDEANGHNAAYLIVSRQAGAPESRVYTDILGREVFSATETLGDKTVVAWQSFDRRGRVTSAVDGHFEDASPTEYGRVDYSDFDGLDRARHKEVRQSPKDYDVDYTFDGLRQVVDVTPRGPYGGFPLTMESKRTISGAPLWHQDAEDQKTHFRYDALGNPAMVRDVAGNDITALYNGFGHKTAMTDPNMGTWQFSYNTLGELRRQVDAQSQVTTFTYDKLGRITTQSRQGEAADVFRFDEGGLYGQLTSENKGSGFARQMGFDSLARPITVTTTIDGSIYRQSMSYDSNYGRVKGQSYPDGTLVHTQYSAEGIAHIERDFNRGVILRTVEALNAQGSIIRQSFANGLREFSDFGVAGLLQSRCVMSLIDNSCGSQGVQYLNYDEYDSFGNLLHYSNEEIGQQERFVYDNQHRLTKSTRTWNTHTPVTSHAVVNYDYDAVGNLLYKSDFSTQSPNAYQYGNEARSAGNAGPNAVRTVALNTGGTKIYDYDLNGNLISDGIRTISYGVNNKPSQVSASGKSLSFSYGSDNQRYKQVKTVDGVTTTTHYIGAHEVEVKGASKTTRTALGDFAMYKVENGVGEWFFTHRDHLGSVETITDSVGSVAQRRGYDPFGKSRDSQYDDSQSGLLQSSISPRGFTNHEHLDDVELIHMNGRMYDYNLGRFLSVDPFVAMPENSQAYNPYSYVMNNPLSYTDPTGYVAQQIPQSENRDLGYRDDDLLTYDPETKTFEVCGVDGECMSYVIGNGAGSRGGADTSESSGGGDDTSVSYRDGDEEVVVVTHHQNSGGSSPFIMGPVSGFVMMIMGEFGEDRQMEARREFIQANIDLIPGSGIVQSIYNNEPISPTDVLLDVAPGGKVAKSSKKLIRKSDGGVTKGTSKADQLRQGKDVRAKDVKEAREILDSMPELRPGPGNVSPGMRDRRNTFRGDLINTKDPTSSKIHDRGKHSDQPHFNVDIRDSNGVRHKPAIFIDD